MRVLQIGADRSKRGILYPESPAVARQRAYGEHFDALDIIGFSVRGDRRTAFEVSDKVHVYPTNSISKLFYGIDTIRIARTLPQFDVISVQDPFEAGLLGLLLSRIFRVPLHIQVHTDVFDTAYRTHSFINRMRAEIARIVLVRAVRIRVVSRRIADSIKSQTETKAPITVLPIFADTARLRENVHHVGLEVRFSQFKTKLLVVSRLEAEKDVALALRSFAHAAPEDACLIVVGDGSERTMLTRLAENLNIQDRVFFEGEKSGLEYYPFADLVLVTSRYEGYGLVIIEALAAGKPVLSTDVGVARDAGAIVATEADYAEALKQWFQNGPRTGVLKDYPYQNLEQYVKAYCDDIAACKS